jgi:hypothetical protein
MHAAAFAISGLVTIQSQRCRTEPKRGPSIRGYRSDRNLFEFYYSPMVSTLGEFNVFTDYGARETFVELFWQDVRYGLRQLCRNRGFPLTAIVTLGLGIGATTSIFSAVYALLLRPLPYYDANRLVSISDLHSAPLLDPDFVAAENVLLFTDHLWRN